jgi:adenylate cyclase
MGLIDSGRSLAHRAALIVRQIGTLRLIATCAMLIAAVLLARFSWNLTFAADAEANLYDFRAAAAAPKVDQDNRIVVIAYDDDTLIQTGKRSPLDRTVLAKALTRIDAMGAKSIGIDILIDQPQPEDPALIAAFRGMKTPTWLAYASNATNGDKITWEQQKFLDAFLASLKPGNVRPASIRLQAERDNVLRRWPDDRRDLPPLLALAASGNADGRAYLGASLAYRLPTDQDRGVYASIPIQTLADDAIFSSPEAAALFTSQIAGRHVLIGGHIQDIDLFSTPVMRVSGKQMWGIDAFAQMLSQQLDGKHYAPIPDWVLWIAALGVVTAAIVAALAALRSVPLLILLIAQLTVIGVLPFWLHARMIDTFGLPVFGWGSGWVLAFLAVGSAARAVGSEQRRFAQSALGKYLPRDIAAQILRDPEGLSLKGEKRELFIVFTDLEGFTKLSHALAPETVATLLNRYLETLSDVVLAHGGTIDKFVGDAVVAFWGAPIARDDDGERAVKAAIAMHGAGEEFRRNVPDGVPAIGRTRVGLHFGEAIVGNFGGEGRIQYTALGDAMNTASRLESANKQLGTSILISLDAAERSGLEGFRMLGTVEVRGRATPVDIVEPSSWTNTALHDFANKVAAAQRGDNAARESLTTMAAMHPDDAALRNLVYRLDHKTEGGYFVLD